MVVAYQFFDTVAPGDFVKCDFLLYHFIRGENKGFQYIDFLFDLLDQFLYLFGIGDDDYGKFPDFVNVSPKNHLQIMGRYVDVVS